MRLPKNIASGAYITQKAACSGITPSETFHGQLAIINLID